MAEDAMMRFLLLRVLAYRELCRSVRNSGRGNVFFAGLMLALAYMTFQPNAAGIVAIVYILYVGLALAELAVGLFKWFFPSAEGILFDAILQLVFAGWNLGWQGLIFAAGQPPNYFIVILGVLMLTGSFRRFQSYLELRKAFADRPTNEQIRWFDDLIREIKQADPELDDLALDLPTKPHYKAKLLGATAFFVEKSGRGVLILGPWDFTLHEDGERVRLQIVDREYKPFAIDESSLKNYRKWMASFNT